MREQLRARHGPLSPPAMPANLGYSSPQRRRQRHFTFLICQPTRLNKRLCHMRPRQPSYRRLDAFPMRSRRVPFDWRGAGAYDSNDLRSFPLVRAEPDRRVRSRRRGPSGGVDMQSITAALITMDGCHEPQQTVLPRVIGWIDRAANEGAQMVLFPELTIGHYHEVPVSLEGPEVGVIREIAQKRSVGIGVGIGEVYGNALYSSYVLFNPDGSFGVHRKTRWQTPRCPISLGARAEVHDFFGLRAGVMVCAESRFPEVAEELRRGIPQLLIVPFAVGRTVVPAQPERNQQLAGDIWAQEVALRAREIGCPAVVISATGSHEQTVDGAPWKEILDGGWALIDKQGNMLQIRRTDCVEMFRFQIVKQADHIPCDLRM